MSYVRLKIAVMAIALSAAAAPAGHAENLALRNCNWCHGGSGQGYTPAPRLAGQRPQYVETQLVNFTLAHPRQSVLENVHVGRCGKSQSSGGARSGCYYSTLTPRAANDGDRDLVANGRAIYQEGMPDCQHRGLRRLSWPECRGHQANSSLGRAGLFLLEKTARAVGRRISCGRRPADARVSPANCRRTKSRRWRHI